MNRSFIFSFKTLSLPVRRLFPGLLLTVGLFVGVDSITRSIDPMKLYGGWENPHIQYKYEFAKKLHKKHGRLDVMLISTSIGLQTDVDEWQEATGNQVICYNAAMGGQKPQWAQFMFENVYYPALKPKAVVYCVSPRDVNAGGLPAARWNRNGPFWNSVRARAILAEKPVEKVMVTFERASYLFSARRHIRRYIQQGPIPEDKIVITEENGVDLPTVRNLADTPPTAQARLRAGNHYKDFSMPEDGESAGLLAIANFCKKKGVKFVLLNQPVAPAAYALFNDPQKDYQVYLNGLERLRKSGVEVLDMAKDLDLGSQHFGDDDHPNRWGAASMASYIYEKVIVKWFPDKTIVDKLPEQLQVNLYDVTSRTNRDFFPQDRSRVPPHTMYASELQMITRTAGSRIPINTELRPGSYSCDLYSADERTTRTEGAREHELALELLEGDTTKSLPFKLSRNIVQGAALTRFRFSVENPASLALRVNQLHGTECVLDALFLDRTVQGGDPRIPIPWDTEGLKVPDPYLVRNGGFEHYAADDKSLPAEWYRYTREREPWGSAELVRQGRKGTQAVSLAWSGKPASWGSLIVQDITVGILPKLRGNTCRVSVWARSDTPKVYAGVQVLPEMKDVLPLTKYSATGSWQQLSADVEVSTSTQRLSITIGSLDKQPVLFDDLEISRLD